MQYEEFQLRFKDFLSKKIQFIFLNEWKMILKNSSQI